jgi:hypothetical protein
MSRHPLTELTRILLAADLDPRRRRRLLAELDDLNTHGGTDCGLREVIEAVQHGTPLPTDGSPLDRHWNRMAAHSSHRDQPIQPIVITDSSPS